MTAVLFEVPSDYWFHCSIVDFSTRL